MKEKDRILIIEDEPGILSTLQIALEEEGYLSFSAMTGEAGLLSLSKNPHLILLDLGLPDQSGFEVLKSIRKDHQTPVILLTARSSEIDKVLGLELGADDYVVKPFSPRELIARIKAVLRRTDKKEKSDESLLRIDVSKKLIFFAGQSLSLSPYEYKTLALFFKYPGRIFSREEIMDNVWTEPEDSFDRAVDTVIKNIRSRFKEIQKDFDPIETRRGEGYGLKEKI
ncbi:response regulator [Leptospira idonii]|uniref:Response regulator n=1 Tax=Leptospira idonii TaxID=1193500 RepID=A0A4R9LZY0_9LEPT|nr:response regulator [Leptospira idonii]TGN19322.1 response regulator [Leptospira idonii]